MGKKAYKQLTKINPPKEKKQNQVGIYIQLGLTLASIILLIVYFFKPQFMIYLQITFALDLLMMAYNNKTTYKRRYFSVLYVIMALVILGIILYDWLGA